MCDSTLNSDWTSTDMCVCVNVLVHLLTAGGILCQWVACSRTEGSES